MTFTLLTGIVSACSGPSEERGPSVAAVHADDAAGGGAGPARPVAHAPQERARPVKVAVPAIFIEAPVTPLGLDRKGQLGAPPLSTPMTVGWHRHGPSPGDAGTAVLVGHRDTATGPAIFLNLKMLRRGDAVKVTRADRRIAVFTVDEVQTYTKDKFPNRKVYGHSSRAELRLITCGGRFDKKHGYSANVVVFAHLASLKKHAA
ncbi:class F sortase [Streptomyces sp. NPDC056470]|uniref:class F sortase n=2 Tax=Streptomyces TaxID=1883 RepID=UPI00368ED55B